MYNIRTLVRNVLSDNSTIPIPINFTIQIMLSKI